MYLDSPDISYWNDVEKMRIFLSKKIKLTIHCQPFTNSKDVFK